MNVPMFVSDARATLVDFSRPVWAAGDGFIVRAADAARWKGYEAIAADPAARLAVVVAQIQEQTALRAGVPPERIVRFPDQDAAAAAVKAGDADASASTALGSRAFLQRAGDPALVFSPDAPRDGLPVGAFSFAKTSPDLTAAFDEALGRYLGTEHHLAMMCRYGFTRDDLAPVL
jgi:polar amino acid transport system substrate-binding protein